MKEHPTGWKKEHTAFINGLYEKARRGLERLERQPGAKEKIAQLIEMRRKKVSHHF